MVKSRCGYDIILWTKRCIVLWLCVFECSSFELTYDFEDRELFLILESRGCIDKGCWHFTTWRMELRSLELC